MLNDFIFLICGKSGSGKTTIVNLLQQRFGLEPLPSHTTRQPRHADDNDHIFSTTEEYEYQLSLDNVMAETIFDDNIYWVTEDQIEKADTYVIDLKGIMTLSQRYRGHKHIVTIYIDSDVETCVEHMQERGDDIEAIWKRVRFDNTAFPYCSLYADYIIDGNEDIDTVFYHVVEVITQEIGYKELNNKSNTTSF